MKKYFSLTEWILWAVSVAVIVWSFFLAKATNYLTLIASVVGTTSLIFNAKGNPIGQMLMVVFSVLYGIISYGHAYYGEMITYLGMTMPMAVVALISWLRHPYKGNHKEVKIAQITKYDLLLMALLTAVVTTIFFFILRSLETANLFWSTLSVATSFVAVFLTYKRSPWFAIAYALNDIVLIVLWILATQHNTGYLSVVVCFVIFLANDVYGFVNWQRTFKKQKMECANEQEEDDDQITPSILHNGKQN